MVSKKIALCMICRSDEQEDRLVRCLSSISPFVDKIYATITNETGLPDEGVAQKVYKKFGAEISWFKWIKDFSAAREFNLKQVSDDYPYIFWCDSDDIVLGGNNLHGLAESMSREGIGALFCTYYYQLSPAGFEHFKNTGEVQENQVMIKHLRERLVKKDLYHWVGKLHETLIEMVETKKVDTRDLAVVHTAQAEDLSKALTRNIDILEKTLDEETKKKKRDPRTVYYLGKAYFDLHDEKYREISKTLLKEYLQTSGWQEERAQAWEYLSTMCMEDGKNEEALDCALLGLKETPKFSSTWLQVAVAYARMAQWDKARFWAEMAAKVPAAQSTLIINTRGNALTLLEILFGEAVERNDIDESYKRARQIFELAPEHPAAKSRMEFIEDIRRQRDTIVAIVNVANYLKSKGEAEKLLPLITAVPADISNNKAVEDIRKSIIKPRDWGKEEIAIYCGQGWEKWSAKNFLEWKNLAGSEEAVVRLSKELTKKGWKVTVYGNPMEDEGEYDGVTYLNYYKFNPKDSFNILVYWRVPGWLSNDVKAKKFYLWMHDIPNPVEFTKERVDKVEKIFVLSKWHRDCLRDIPDEKFLITGNGIDVSQFGEKKIERDPFRCIYASSYDRGLEHLLKMWPNIRKAVPKANLHIFYGWGLFDKMFYNNPERKMWKEKMCKLMEQEGIAEYGKVSQDQIVEETYKSGLWTYPTHFGEISCITAMKCQAAGAVPIVMDYAAVHETVQHGVKVEGDIYDDESKTKYEQELIKALKNPEWQESVRKEMMPWAVNKFDWATVATQWSEEFHK